MNVLQHRQVDRIDESLASMQVMDYASLREACQALQADGYEVKEIGDALGLTVYQVAAYVRPIESFRHYKRPSECDRCKLRATCLRAAVQLEPLLCGAGEM